MNRTQLDNTRLSTRRSGFTLVELLVVITMVGVISVVAIPSMRPSRFRVDAAALELFNVLALAQRTAVLKGHDIIVAFDEDGTRLRVHSDANNNGSVEVPEDVRYVVLPEGVMFGRKGAPPRAIGTAPVTFSYHQDGLPAVRFHRSGAASEAGGFYLVPAGGAVLDEHRAMEIDRGTGRTRCFAYRDSGWEEAC